VQKLRKFTVPTADTDALLAYFFSMARDNSMHELGIGTMRSMRSVVSGVLLPSLQSRGYTLRQKLNIWRGKLFLQKSTGVGKEMLTTNLSARITRLDIPVYFMSGLHDYTVARPLSREYLAAIQAPLKGFYTFASSAHSPLFEEPEAFLHVMTQDVLQGRSDLADRE
jgi:pimeloyl-ACP methyl ester carboxylesterase